MNITEIKMRRKENHGRLKAVACLIFDGGDYVINDIHIVQGENHLFVQFPRWGDGRSIFAPLNQQARSKIEDEILKAYRTV